jgi:Protein of unknown function (DUF4232)
MRGVNLRLGLRMLRRISSRWRELPRLRRVRCRARRTSPAAAAGLVALSLAGCGGSTSRPRSTTSSTCEPGALRLGLTGPHSGRTGEHSRRFTLSNVSQSPCTLHGSPRVSLYADGRRLPFRYDYPAGTGRETYVSGKSAQAVLLRSGSVAFFDVAKFRCESGGGAEATEMHILLPGSARTLTIALPAGGGYGVNVLTYCGGSNTAATHAGRHIDVSAIIAPFER